MATGNIFFFNIGYTYYELICQGIVKHIQFRRESNFFSV